VLTQYSMLPGKFLKKNQHPAVHPGVREAKVKDRHATDEGSVVFLVFVFHVRPQVLIAGRVPEVIFNRPQITEGVVLQVHITPPLGIPAVSAVPVKSVTAAVRRQASFTFAHPLSPHLRDSLKKNLKNHPLFRNKKISTEGHDVAVPGVSGTRARAGEEGVTSQPASRTPCRN
jgi:hypothetical protein